MQEEAGGGGLDCGGLRGRGFYMIASDALPPIVERALTGRRWTVIICPAFTKSSLADVGVEMR